MILMGPVSCSGNMDLALISCSDLLVFVVGSKGVVWIVLGDAVDPGGDKFCATPFRCLQHCSILVNNHACGFMSGVVEEEQVVSGAGMQWSMVGVVLFYMPLSIKGLYTWKLCCFGGDWTGIYEYSACCENSLMSSIWSKHWITGMAPAGPKILVVVGVLDRVLSVSYLYQFKCMCIFCLCCCNFNCWALEIGKTKSASFRLCHCHLNLV